MRRYVLALVLTATLTATAAAQGGSKSVVGVDAAGPSGPVAAGSSFEVRVTLEVKAGYHINAQKPSEEYLIGTSLKLSPTPGVKISKVAYPSARLVKFAFSETPLAVYEGAVRIVATLRSDASLAPGPQSIAGKVTFQACNDQACLPPSTVDVTANVEIGAPAKATAALTLTGAPPAARVSVDGRAVGRVDTRGQFVARDLEPGRRRVRVELDGFEAWEQAIGLDAARPQTIAVSLIEVKAPTAIEQPGVETIASPPAPEVDTGAPAPPLTPAAQQSPSSGWPSALYLVPVGVGIAAALIFAASRNRARSAASRRS
jgi:hypothetical protein